MTTAQNLQELYEGGYIRQAFEFAISMSVGYEYEGEGSQRKYLIFFFPDGSEWVTA